MFVKTFMHEKHIDGYCVHMNIQRSQKQIQVQNNQKQKMEQFIKSFTNCNTKMYLNFLIALHVEKNTLTKAKHFLLMDLSRIFSINEYSSQIAY
jgi:hypothetical protein